VLPGQIALPDADDPPSVLALWRTWVNAEPIARLRSGTSREFEWQICHPLEIGCVQSHNTRRSEDFRRARVKEVMKIAASNPFTHGRHPCRLQRLRPRQITKKQTGKNSLRFLGRIRRREIALYQLTIRFPVKQSPAGLY
jgi:hypothetical protein